ncbi:plasminogen-like, partial [Anneissia japonica]|uniref:plasminogen-like n=1 Tax=Anneissia japonica TaxID=1529436 RepID=UPI001425B91F
HTPENYPEAGLSDHNFCRNPGQQQPTAWCYTVNPETILEMCNVTHPGENCGAYEKTNDADYRGSVNITITGKSCQKWTSQTPHQHAITPANFPDTGLGDHNFCRNPDQELTVWCYTTDPESRFELCDIDRPEDNDFETPPTTGEIPTNFTRYGNVSTALPVTPIEFVMKTDTQRLSNQQTLIPNMETAKSLQQKLVFCVFY